MTGGCRFKRFWLVWSPQGETSPTRRHYDKQEAVRAAQSMAQRIVGKQFFVVEAIGQAHAPEPKARFAWADDRDDGIPF